MALKMMDRVKYLSDKLDQGKLVEIGYQKFKTETPIRTGNARSKTYKRNSEIQAAYPYAKRLDDGYSRQAPKGMVEPTIEAIRKYIAQIIGK